MALNLEQIAEQALALPGEARARLADRLVESLDPAEDKCFRTLWSEEALRRRDEVRNGRVKTIPAREVLRRVRKVATR